MASCTWSLWRKMNLVGRMYWRLLHPNRRYTSLYLERFCNCHKSQILKKYVLSYFVCCSSPAENYYKRLRFRGRVEIFAQGLLDLEGFVFFVHHCQGPECTNSFVSGSFIKRVCVLFTFFTGCHCQGSHCTCIDTSLHADCMSPQELACHFINTYVPSSIISGRKYKCWAAGLLFTYLVNSHK